MDCFVEKKRLTFLGLPWTLTSYTITEELVKRKTGLFKQVEDTCYIYKIQDVRLEKTLVERMFGLGTVICFTGDTTDKELRLVHVRNSDVIKDYLVKTSDEERIKRRTINTVNITADSSDDIDYVN